MELAISLLAKRLENQPMYVHFPQLELSAKELLESTSYQALCQIREILLDDTLSDPKCFQKIERIVRVFEAFGSDCGHRHDF